MIKQNNALTWGFFLTAAVVFSLAFLAATAEAAIIYERTPSGAQTTSPVSVNVSVDNVSELGIGGAPNINFWGVVAFDLADTFYRGDTCVATSTLSISTNIFIPENTGIISVDIMLGTDENDCLNTSELAGNGLEYDGGNIIFSVVAGSGLIMFTVPTSTAGDVLANVSSTLGDTGFLIVLAAAAAIPLVFYVAKQLIGLIPKSRSRVQ